jgi:hypothetical protein
VRQVAGMQSVARISSAGWSDQADFAGARPNRGTAHLTLLSRIAHDQFYYARRLTTAEARSETLHNCNGNGNLTRKKVLGAFLSRAPYPVGFEIRIVEEDSEWTGRPLIGSIRASGRKVRAPQDKVVGNAHRPQGPGKCNRKQTA